MAEKFYQEERQKRIERCRQYRARKKQALEIAGVCIYCDRFAMPGRAWCAVCSEAHTFRKSKTRAEYRAKGLCRTVAASAGPMRQGSLQEMRAEAGSARNPVRPLLPEATGIPPQDQTAAGQKGGITMEKHSIYGKWMVSGPYGNEDAGWTLSKLQTGEPAEVVAVFERRIYAVLVAQLFQQARVR